jgi:hypothetical protein
MAVPINQSSQPPSYDERALRDLEHESKRDAEERVTGWTVVWTLFAFKMATVGLIWYTANGTRDEGYRTDSLLVATTWYWLIIPAVAISGLVAYRLRLRATRKRVADLKRAEFMATQATSEHGTIGASLSEAEKERLRQLQRRRQGGSFSG